MLIIQTLSDWIHTAVRAIAEFVNGTVPRGTHEGMYTSSHAPRVCSTSGPLMHLSPEIMGAYF